MAQLGSLFGDGDSTGIRFIEAMQVGGLGPYPVIGHEELVVFLYLNKSQCRISQCRLCDSHFVLHITPSKNLEDPFPVKTYHQAEVQSIFIL